MERKEYIESLLAKRFTYTEIGKLLGISRQRVHQIYTGYNSPSNKSIKGISDNQSPKLNSANLILNRPFSELGFNGSSRDRVRKLVRIRDKRKCQVCGFQWKKGNRRLDVHHLDEEHEGKSFEKGAATWDREHLDRMITLCHKCHLNLDSVKKKMSIAQRRLLTKKVKIRYLQ